VVAPRLAGIPDQVRHASTGFLVEPGDEADYIAKLELLMNNPLLARQMGRDAQEFAERTCSREVVFGNITQALREAAAERAVLAPMPGRGLASIFTRRRPASLAAVG
jgi:glycosyltransferase involved in cell wall biosynthesis